MTQTDKVSTNKVSITLDPLSQSHLDYCMSWYRKHGKELSNTVVIRRALDVLMQQLSMDYDRRDKPYMLELEVDKATEHSINRKCPFDSKYPWANLARTTRIKAYKDYFPSPIARLPNFLNEACYIK